MHAACWKHRTQKSRQKSPSGHHRTTLSVYIFAAKARIDNRKKLVKQQYILHMSPQYGELWLTISSLALYLIATITPVFTVLECSVMDGHLACIIDEMRCHGLCILLPCLPVYITTLSQNNLSHHRPPSGLRTDSTALWLVRFFWASRFLFIVSSLVFFVWFRAAD